MDDVLGLMARYKNAMALLAAARKAREQGYSAIEAYSPFPVEGLSDCLEQKESALPWIVFTGGVIGAVSGFMMEYIANVWAYPLNIGARPFNSWPAFVPIAFELTILVAAISGFVGLVLRCGFPRLNHPVFSVPDFKRATIDSFFLCIFSKDIKFNLTGTKEFLGTTGPEEIYQI